MGKNKKKTKANTRPSSSSHSAELLNNSGTVASPGVIGFQNYQLNSTIMNTALLMLEKERNPNVRLIAKTMLKKDVVTKLKGIQEFVGFCSNENETAQFLPYFPWIYNKLAMENDLRVREGIQKALTTYIPVLKTNALYVKNIMATWLIAQCDPCPAAAAAAQSAFLMLFSEKQSEAVMLYQSEILDAMNEYLCKMTESSLKESSGLTEEASKERYELILICSVRGLKLFISLLSEKDKKTVIEPISCIIKDKRFWAHSQSTITKVRVAWYELLKMLISKMPEVIEETKQLICLLLSSLWKGDSQVIHSIWNCALQAFTSFENWWHMIDVSSLLISPLLEFLSAGGNGNAAVVYPLLPDFLRQLMVVDNVKSDIVMEFFSSIHKSFFVYKLKSSPKECDTVMTGYFSCLRTVVDLLIQDTERLNYVKELLERQVMSLIQTSFKSKGCHIAATSFYALLGLYLKDFELCMTHADLMTTENSDESPYCTVLSYIWERLSSEMISYLNEEPEGDNEKDVDILILLLHSLHQPSKYLQAGERRLYYFYGENSASPDSDYFAVSNIISKAKSTASCNSTYLFKYTLGFCEHLCVKLKNNVKPYLLELFAELISEARCEQLFYELLKALQLPVNSSKAAAPFIFFKTVVLEWIESACAGEDSASLDWIRDIIIFICFSVPIDCATIILDICSVSTLQKVFQRLIIQVLQFKEKTEEFFYRWFNSPQFALAFEYMASTFSLNLLYTRRNLDHPEFALCSKALMLCFTEAGSGQPEIPWVPVKYILNFFTSLLTHEQCVNCEFEGDYNFINFICDAAEKLFFQRPSSYLTAHEITSFMFKVFTLSLEWIKLDSKETTKEQQKLDFLWKTYVAYALSKEDSLKNCNFLVMAAEHFHSLLLQKMSKRMHRRVIEVICIFLHSVENSYNNMPVNQSESLLMLLVKIIIPSCKEMDDSRQGLNTGTIADILQGRFFYPFVKGDFDLLPSKTFTVLPFLFMIDAVVELLEKIWDLVDKECSLRVQAFYHEQLCSEYLPNVVWAICYLDAQNYFKAKDTSEPPIFEAVRSHFIYIIDRLNVRQLVAVVALKLLKDHVTWALPFERILLFALKETNSPLDYYPTFYSLVNEYRNNYFSMTQICLKYCSPEFVRTFVADMHEDPFEKNHLETIPADEELCGYVSQLASCVEHHRNDFDSVTNKKVVVILENMVRSEWFKSYDHSSNPLLVTCFTSVAIGIMKDAREFISCDLWRLLMRIPVTWLQECFPVGDGIFEDSTQFIFAQKFFELVNVISEVMVEGLGEAAVYSSTEHLWKTVAFSVISKQLVKRFVNFAGKVEEMGHTSNAIEGLFFPLVQTFQLFSPEDIAQAFYSTHFESFIEYYRPQHVDIVYNKIHEFTSYLSSASMCVQFGIHFLLKKLIVHLIESDHRVNKILDDAENENRFKALPLVEFLEHTKEIVDTILADVAPGECCVIVPVDDSFTYIMANLLAWDIFLEYFNAFVTEERAAYLGCLADSKLLSSMLMNVTCLRPENLAACSNHVPKRPGEDASNVDLHKMPPLYSVGSATPMHLQHVAFCVFVSALKKIPALVRTWWSNLEKKAAAAVEKFTAQHISKVLILNEISAIGEHKAEFDNMMVDVYATSRQVIATYTLDDAAIELAIKIPPNYPLGAVEATSNKRNIVDHIQWRSWMLHLTTFLNYHNGSVKDALVLWKKNLDKKFEGVEECMICFFIFHSSSGTLPNKTCRTCKKKFHASCVFKWFKTNNICSCPICRGDF